MYSMILEKRMTLTSLFSLYFLQIWMAFAYYRVYPNRIFISAYCPDGSCYKKTGMDALAMFYSTLSYECYLPIAILLFVVIVLSKEIEVRNKWKWIIILALIKILLIIGMTIFVIPMPTI